MTTTESKVGADRISFLPVPSDTQVPEAVRKLWAKAEANIGFVPNVFRAQAVNGEQFLAWWNYFNLLLNKEGFLSNVERELVAVVVSAANRCLYCEVSHGAALRGYSGDPMRADAVAVNWRQADLTERERTMAEYAEKLTLRPAEVTEADLTPLRAVGLDDHQIMELVQVIGMFNLTNRVSSALGFVPNAEYYSQGR
ncbi:alkyl hydroperoxide reductase AhpD [Deinococcus aetherius]|uniref:Alkyl hydroperoxide reductase AhpD n=1 Tax=Deinococcus aetherius TaxID=200252 RepID=A0ABM8AEK0_9DEIO|nr:peroxidase-related enzyme [Deinococcus aetherius]BDP42210.1 alkyl hydroperoxide reductase AhpD [Deinococcus aetherius]